MTDSTSTRRCNAVQRRCGIVTAKGSGGAQARLLLKRSANVFCKGKKVATAPSLEPLFNGQLDGADLLLAHGENIAKDNNGGFARHVPE